MFTVLTVALTALAVVHARTGLVRGLVPVEADPSRDLIGWPSIANELKRRGLLDRPGMFVFTGHWHVSGQLAFALGPDVPVLCYHEGDARGFSVWERPGDWIGRDGILVAVDDRSTEPQCFDRWFDRIVPIAQFEITRGGHPVRPVRLFLCRNQTRPFPFDAGPGPGGARSAPTDNREAPIMKPKTARPRDHRLKTPAMPTADGLAARHGPDPRLNTD